MFLTKCLIHKFINVVIDKERFLYFNSNKFIVKIVFDNKIFCFI